MDETKLREGIIDMSRRSRNSNSNIRYRWRRGGEGSTWKHGRREIRKLALL